ncbi:MAG: exodeoxyribonuclease V subunit gamma [Gammaproteobacteria bacterium]|nr:exodeoxyribonuclease V subunit gamma [Gammaproteobacteria bacterium]
MSSLNPQQHAAVQTTDQHLLVLAGAGSGKTRVITEKIAHLINDRQIDPARIVAVTFTNKAAHEMRQRISKRLSGKTPKGLSISTFHTLGLTILQREYKPAGYKARFSIFDATDAQTILQELIKESHEGYIGDAQNACWAISRLKNDLIFPEAALVDAADAQAMSLAKLYARYQRQLVAYNAVDFDDLLLQPVRVLREQGEVLDRWQGSIRHLLVDEYQDTNAVQYALVQLLIGPYAKLTAVGDDDQSIYAWRGARPENLQRLTEDYPDLKIIKLEQNYRSMGRILKCANHVIANNPHTFEKKLWSELGYGDPIRVLPNATADEEAERVISEILHLKFQTRCRNRDIAILYRGNHQSRPFEACLRLHDLPYKVSGGTAFFERAEIKDIIAYLRIITNPDDDAAFLRVINTPRREIGAGTLEKLGHFSRELHSSLGVAAEHNGARHVLGSAAYGRLAGFTDSIREFRLATEHQDAHKLICRLVEDIEYSDWLLSVSKDKPTAEARMKNVQDLLDWIHNLCKRADEPLTLEALVNKLSLMDIIERNEQTQDEDSVQLMTLHAAKGLEFPHVFLVGMEDGVLPHHSHTQADSENTQGLEEERRLLYVGITRAQRTLTITYAGNRKRQGELMSCEPSRFLEELPLDEIEWLGKTADIAPEEKIARGNSRLDSLRELLNS